MYGVTKTLHGEIRRVNCRKMKVTNGGSFEKVAKTADNRLNDRKNLG